MKLLKTLLFLGFLIPSSYSFSQPKEGDWAITLSSFGWYSYENNDARNELPSSITDLLDPQDLTGSDSDVVNITVGAGFYLSDELQLRLQYTDGVELGLFDDFDNFFVSGVDGQPDFNTFDANMTILALDAKYSLYDFNNSLSLYVAGGIVAHTISVEIFNVDDGRRTVIEADNEISFGGVGEVGLQWHISENWGAEWHYSHFTFLSVDHISVLFEYRF